MSKAFTKDDSPEEPLVIPSRAPLPPGATNYVTDRGIALLRIELAGLEAERARLEQAGGSDAEHRHRVAALAARIGDLVARITSAVVVDRHQQPHDQVRFGATVTLRAAGGAEPPAEERRYQIVGVDEADVASGRIAFVAPIARALLGKRVGDQATVHTARGDEEVEIMAIEYEPQ